MELFTGFKIILFLLCTSWINSQPVNGQGCQTCIHINVEINNMPSLVKSILETTLSQLQVVDRQCMNGTSPIQTCPVISKSLITKCQAVHVTMTSYGLGTLFPEASMVTSLMLRSCVLTDETSKDGCIREDAIGLDIIKSVNEFTGRLHQQWNNITVQAVVCQNSSQSTIV